MISDKKTIKLSAQLLLLSLIGFAISCGGSSNSDSSGTSVPVYQIKTSNGTANQPIAPIAFILHDSTYSPWVAGSSDNASLGLEELAEAGSTETYINEAEASSGVLATETTTGILGAGSSETVEMTITSSENGLWLTTAGMLVNTNDAFAGFTELDLSSLSIGESLQTTAYIWDAGTESNSETAASIPGPAGGGTGFDSARDDVDFIHIHPGVVTSDDGLSTSALDVSHKFDQPGISITITRTQ